MKSFLVGMMKLADSVVIAHLCRASEDMTERQ